MKKAVIGVVETREQAEQAVAALQANGFAANEISALLPDKRGTQDFAHEQHTKAPEGGLAGAGIGGVVGGTVGLLAGIGALAIPGLGPLIAAGPIMAALSGAAAGAGVGGLTGALIGMGIPEVEAKVYEGKLRGGNILIAVHTESADARKLADDVFRRAGAREVTTTTEASVPSARR